MNLQRALDVAKNSELETVTDMATALRVLAEYIESRDEPESHPFPKERIEFLRNKAEELRRKQSKLEDEYTSCSDRLRATMTELHNL